MLNWHILILKNYSLLIWCSSLPAYPLFLFAKSSNLTPQPFRIALLQAHHRTLLETIAVSDCSVLSWETSFQSAPTDWNLSEGKAQALSTISGAPFQGYPLCTNVHKGTHREGAWMGKEIHPPLLCPQRSPGTRMCHWNVFFFFSLVCQRSVCF